jgi:hypothetical protein
MMANEKRRLIDVNKVIGAMQKCLDESPDKKGSVAYVAFESIITCLKQEPTVDAVEVVHGRWELYGNDDSLGGSYFCSECGYCLCEEEYLDQFSSFRFCPYCGADMRERKE